MKPLPVLAVAGAASAHTLFTTLFINGVNQGDGTCVRMPRDSSTANGPVRPVTGDDMACGRDGGEPVAYTCAAPRAATLTFEFRMHSNGEKPGAIAEGHRGPCAVYVKRVDDMARDKAAGPGWLKIWEDGYDGRWCVDRLIANKGLLSVDLPSGLPAGYYLVRPEILALHNAPQGDPQFYLGCAQVFVDEGPQGRLEMPRGREASIPGHVRPETPGLTYNLYDTPPAPYPMPGPAVFVPAGGGPTARLAQEQGVVPRDCLVKNANWCGRALAGYSGAAGCWAAVKECYRQGQACWDGAPPSGDANCKVWQQYCEHVESGCDGSDARGPPAFAGKEKLAAVPGAIPRPWHNVFGGAGRETHQTAATAEATSAAAPSPTHGDMENKAAQVEAGRRPDGPGGEGHVRRERAGSGAGSGSGSGPAASLKVSTDGRCGGSTGQTCRGSSFGSCCSSKGWCGRSTRHRGCGCQAESGQCRKR